jgi:transposase
MRGSDRQTGSMFSYVSPEALVPADHPLRPIRLLVNRALERLSGDFDALYAAGGRDSIAPEKLLRALLLQALYSVRSERRLMEQVTYNMLFRWFIGLSMDAPVWDVTVFTKNRDRLLRGEVAGKFFAAVLADPQVKPLLSSEHFSLDGTLIEAWASMKSFRPKDGSGAPPGPGRNGERDFHGEKRSNETHASTTDPDARLARKSNGQASKLCYAGHVVMENRHGLAVAASTTRATGTAERDAGEAMMAGLDRAARSTLGGDKNYDTRDFVAAMRRLGVTPHVAQHTNGRRSAIDGRTTRHPGYEVSQRIRKRIEMVWSQTTNSV